jgi:hypothetical protein
MHLRNFRVLQRDYTALYPRRVSSCLPLLGQGSLVHVLHPLLPLNTKIFPVLYRISECKQNLILMMI